MKTIRPNWITVRKLLRWVFVLGGAIFFLQCLIALTSIPFWVYYGLATQNSGISVAPKTIIMLSGSGIPSESGLIRTYYTARLSATYPHAMVVIALPGNPDSTFSSTYLIRNELILRGVNPVNIEYENQGRNTREQALKWAEGKSPGQKSEPITIVTSPEHMKRAILAFRKVGFTLVSGLPTFENSLDAPLTFNDIDLKGNRFAPEIGKNLTARYQFWNHLKLEILVMREYVGLMYYKLRGWI